MSGPLMKGVLDFFFSYLDWHVSFEGLGILKICNLLEKIHKFLLMLKCFSQFLDFVLEDIYIVEFSVLQIYKWSNVSFKVHNGKLITITLVNWLLESFIYLVN